MVKSEPLPSLGKEEDGPAAVTHCISTQAQGPANSVSFPSNKRSLERRWCVLLCVTVLPGEVFFSSSFFWFRLLRRLLSSSSFLKTCFLPLLLCGYVEGQSVSNQLPSQKPVKPIGTYALQRPSHTSEQAHRHSQLEMCCILHECILGTQTSSQLF